MTFHLDSMKFLTTVVVNHSGVVQAFKVHIAHPYSPMNISQL